MASEKDDPSGGALDTIAKEAKTLAGKVYDDAAAPSAKAAGTAIGRLIRTGLRPIHLFADAVDKFFDRVEQRLKGVPPDRLLPPPPTIAGPAAMQYALLGDGEAEEVLRRVFEELLAASMDRERTGSTHPAMVATLAQLTPDEAWMLESIDPGEGCAIIEVRTLDLERGNSYRAHGFVCNFGRGIGIDESRQAQYLSNLERLGILRVIWDKQVLDEAHEDTRYDELEERMRAEHVQPNRRPPYSARGFVDLTDFGRDLWRVCVDPASRPTAP